MNVLVIGGSGRVGTMVVPTLAARHQVRLFDRNPPGYGGVDYHSGCVTDANALRAAAQGMEAVVYMAMNSIVNDRNDVPSAFDVNIKGVYLALHAAQQEGIRHAVYTSSMSVYHDLGSRFFSDESVPTDAREVYGLTKRLGEEICRNAAIEWGMSINALRLCLPTPPEKWLAEIRDGEPTIRTSSDDLARAMLAALEFRDGFHAIMISGDYTGKWMRLDTARRLLAWEPLARPIR